MDKLRWASNVRVGGGGETGREVRYRGACGGEAVGVTSATGAVCRGRLYSN
jgi:hypothetical protein